MGDPLPFRASGPRTQVRNCPSTRIPSPSHAAAAACLATSGPPAFGTRRAVRRPLPRATTGTAPRPARHVAPRPGLRPRRNVFRPARLSRALRLPAVGGMPPPARYRDRGVRCLCDASTACAAPCSLDTGTALGAAITRRALRPGNVACGDR